MGGDGQVIAKQMREGGNRCEDESGSQMMEKRGKVQGHLVEDEKEKQ